MRKTLFGGKHVLSSSPEFLSGLLLENGHKSSVFVLETITVSYVLPSGTGAASTRKKITLGILFNIAFLL